MEINKIKKTKLNPRDMTKEARLGLKTSLEEFGDISGIVWNKRTGELIGGNHRWDELKSIYGDKELKFHQLDGTDLFAIYSNGNFTGYTIREVDWDEEKAQAANLTANNQNIAGYFTKEVDTILKNLTDYELFSDLKLGELYIDVSIPEEKYSGGDLFTDADMEGDSEMDDSIFNDSDFADDAIMETEEEAQTCAKAEINILIEGDINIQQATNELKEYLNTKYKVTFINISST